MGLVHHKYLESVSTVWAIPHTKGISHRSDLRQNKTFELHCLQPGMSQMADLDFWVATQESGILLFFFRNQEFFIYNTTEQMKK